MSNYIGSTKEGVSYREHPTRKHHNKPDRYFRYRYKLDSKETVECVGWASEGWTAAKVYELRNKYHSNAKRADGAPRSLKEARAQYKAKQAREQSANAARRTLQGWSKTYLSEKTGKAYTDDKRRLDAFILPNLGDMVLTDISERDVKTMIKQILNLKYSPRTVEQVVVLLGKIMRLAGVSSPPTGKRLVPKYDNKSERFLTKTEAKMLLEGICKRSQRTHDQALLALHCGLRAGEIFKLRTMHCNFDAGTIAIVDPKNRSRNRTLYMSDKARAILKRQSKGKGKARLVFETKEGKQQKQISAVYYRTVDSLSLNDGVTDRRFRVTFHTLRHTYASWLIQAGAVTLYELQKLLGHENISQTERYAKLAPDNLQKSVGYINNHF